MGRIYQPTRLVRAADGTPVLDAHGCPVRTLRTKNWYIRVRDRAGKVHEKAGTRPRPPRAKP